MNARTLIAIVLLTHAAALADSIPFTCATPPAGTTYGVQVQLQRQTVEVSGVIGMNCCARHAYKSSLTGGVMSVMIDNQAFCECLDTPCQFTFGVPTGNQIITRVVVTDNFGGKLLDTTFASTSAGKRRSPSAQRRPVPVGLATDLRGAVIAEPAREAPRAALRTINSK